MKIIITTASPDIDSAVDARFGRATYFVVVDSNTLIWEAHANEATSFSSGAGVQAAQFVVKMKVDAVISGDFGPHAHDALEKAGVQMYLLGQSTTARDALTRLKMGELQRFGEATQHNLSERRK